MGTDKDFCTSVRDVVAALAEGGISVAQIQAAVLRRILHERGLTADCHLDRDDLRTAKGIVGLEWYAGQLLSLIQEQEWDRLTMVLVMAEPLCSRAERELV